MHLSLLRSSPHPSTRLFLFLNFRPFHPSPSLPLCTRHHHNHNPKLTTIELLLHLFKRCPNIQSLTIIGGDWTATEFYFWKRIVSAGFPISIKDLDVKLYSCVSLAKSTLLPMLFDQCSPGLRKLSICMSERYAYRRNRSADVDTRQDVVNTPLPGMKDLSITYTFGDPYPPPCIRFLIRCVNLENLTLTTITHLWSPALEACSHLKSLTTHTTFAEQLQLLATALTNGLPCLDIIRLRPYSSNWSTVLRSMETPLASVLSAGRAGWKSLHLPLLSKTSADVLVKHCSTLEELTVEMSDGVTSQHLYQILSTSPGLVKLDVQTVHGSLARILAEDFVDQDPGFDCLNPWPCELSLKMFRLRIAGIPRPGVLRIPQERVSLVQTQDLQRRVYDRLARFTRLEQLELGNQGIWAGYDEERIQARTETKVQWGYHIDCITMTLNSGLRILEGLKEIRKVNVACMATSIGVEEAKWMVRSWPKLEAIRGLKESYRSRMEGETATWLRTHHPRIQREASWDVVSRDEGGGGGGMYC